MTKYKETLLLLIGVDYDEIRRPNPRDGSYTLLSSNKFHQDVQKVPSSNQPNLNETVDTDLKMNTSNLYSSMERTTAEDLSHCKEMGSKKRMLDEMNLQTVKRNRSESEVDQSISQSVSTGNVPMNLTKNRLYNTEGNRVSDSITINMDLGRDTRRENTLPDKLIKVSGEKVSSNIPEQSFPKEDVPRNFTKMDAGNVGDNERKDVPFNFHMNFGGRTGCRREEGYSTERNDCQMLQNVNRNQEINITGNLGDRHQWMDRDLYYKETQLEECGEAKRRGINIVKTFTPRVIKTEEIIQDGKLDIGDSNGRHSTQNVGQMSRCVNNRRYADTSHNNETAINLSYTDGGYMSSTGSNGSYTDDGHMSRMKVNISKKYGAGNVMNLSDRGMNNTVDSSYIGGPRNVMNDSLTECKDMTRSVMDASYRNSCQRNQNAMNASHNDGRVFNESTSYRAGQEINQNRVISSDGHSTQMNTIPIDFSYRDGPRNTSQIHGTVMNMNRMNNSQRESPQMNTIAVDDLYRNGPDNHSIMMNGSQTDCTQMNITPIHASYRDGQQMNTSNVNGGNYSQKDGPGTNRKSMDGSHTMNMGSEVTQMSLAVRNSEENSRPIELSDVPSPIANWNHNQQKKPINFTSLGYPDVCSQIRNFNEAKPHHMNSTSTAYVHVASHIQNINENQQQEMNLTNAGYPNVASQMGPLYVNRQQQINLKNRPYPHAGLQMENINANQQQQMNSTSPAYRHAPSQMQNINENQQQQMNSTSPAYRHGPSQMQNINENQQQQMNSTSPAYRHAPSQMENMNENQQQQMNLTSPAYRHAPSQMENMNENQQQHMNLTSPAYRHAPSQMENMNENQQQHMNLTSPAYRHAPSQMENMKENQQQQMNSTSNPYQHVGSQMSHLNQDQQINGTTSAFQRVHSQMGHLNGNQEQMNSTNAGYPDMRSHMGNLSHDQQMNSTTSAFRRVHSQIGHLNADQEQMSSTTSAFRHVDSQMGNFNHDQHINSTTSAYPHMTNCNQNQQHPEMNVRSSGYSDVHSQMTNLNPNVQQLDSTSVICSPVSSQVTNLNHIQDEQMKSKSNNCSETDRSHINTQNNVTSINSQISGTEDCTGKNDKTSHENVQVDQNSKHDVTTPIESDVRPNSMQTGSSEDTISGYQRSASLFSGYQLQHPQVSNRLESGGNINIQSADQFQYNVQESPRINYPLNVTPQIDYNRAARERNLTDFIASELKRPDSRQVEAVLAAKKRKLLDKAFMDKVKKLEDREKEMRSFSKLKVVDGHGNVLSTEDIMNLDSAENDEDILHIDVESIDEDDYATLRRTLLHDNNKENVAINEDNGKIQCEGTFFPGKRYQSGSITYREDNTDEDLKNHTNGKLETNAEENSRIFKKPQFPVEFLKGYRPKGSKAVVSPLPGSQSTQGTDKSPSIDLTSSENGNQQTSADNDDYTDITYGN